MSRTKLNLEIIVQIWDELHDFAYSMSPRCEIHRMDMNWLQDAAVIILEHADTSDEGNITDCIRDWIFNYVDQHLVAGGTDTFSVFDNLYSEDQTMVLRMSPQDLGFSWSHDGWAVNASDSIIGHAIQEHVAVEEGAVKLVKKKLADMYPATVQSTNVGADDPSNPLFRQ